MFNTGIDSGDNVRTWIGNTRILNENIQNYSVNAWRRVELKLSLPAGVDAFDTMTRLTERAAKVPHVLSDPKPSATLTSVDGAGTVALYVASPPTVYPHVLDGLTRAAAEVLKEQSRSSTR
jgi:small conductance mechanosensitive channel